MALNPLFLASGGSIWGLCPAPTLRRRRRAHKEQDPNKDERDERSTSVHSIDWISPRTNTSSPGYERYQAAADGSFIVPVNAPGVLSIQVEDNGKVLQISGARPLTCHLFHNKEVPPHPIPLLVDGELALDKLQTSPDDRSLHRARPVTEYEAMSLFNPCCGSHCGLFGSNRM